jgi:hypothetical protein
MWTKKRMLPPGREKNMKNFYFLVDKWMDLW